MDGENEIGESLVAEHRELLLLGLELNGEDLVLRADSNGWGTDQGVEPPVVVLRLAECEGVEAVFGLLETHLGEEFSYELRSSGLRTAVYLYVEYGYQDWGTVYCKHLTESLDEYTVQDLLLKGEKLAKLRALEWREHSRSLRLYNSFVRHLEGETKEELRRCRRKIEFFNQTRAEKAAEVAAEMKAYERVLKRINEFWHEYRG